MRRLNLIRFLIFLATVVGAWGLLSLGGSETTDLAAGQIASRDYEARYANTVIDQVETEKLQQEAAAEVEDVLRQDANAENAAFNQLNELLAAVTEFAIDESAAPPTLIEPDVVPATTDTTAAAEDVTTTSAPLVLTATGRVYLDVDGDGVYMDSAEGRRADQGLRSMTLYLYDVSGNRIGITETQADGTWTVQVNPGLLSVAVDPSDPDFPSFLKLSTANILQQFECGEEACEAPPVGFGPAVRSQDEQVADLQVAFPGLEQSTLENLAFYATEDVVRQALAEPPVVGLVIEAATNKLQTAFENRVTNENLNGVRDDFLTQPPIVVIGGVQDATARSVAADLAYWAIRANYVLDPQATEAARAEARATVEPVEISYQSGQMIARQGTELHDLEIDAIIQTGAVSATEGSQSGGMLTVLAAMVSCLGFYLARFRQDFWARPRMAALLGLLVVLAAGAVRLTIEIQDNVGAPEAWYVLPGVVFGLMAAVLFDARAAALMALVIAVLTATGTRDPGVVTYGLLSAMVPVGFVSSLSSRGSYRKAVLASSLAAAAIAGAVAWFFHTNADQEGWYGAALAVGQSAGLALGVSLLTALLGLAALQFLETAFDITTSLRLLELTDRNHEALVLLQEKAFGSFNHSLMVGTLADAAARAVGADPLLARAAAYYHDLGKTQDPTYFIENQFGAQNPHDDLDPRQSVEMIRRHVTDGVELARKYKIPTEVAEGIVTHHGDGIMRYFYEKARQASGDDEVDPNDFRHIGHKPRTAEMAIVMLADSLEAACRAVFRDEEPTAEAIDKVVNRVVDEKVNDGQLSESDLTLSQLTKARRAFLEALVGHYHQRIAYPNFPGS
jgi:putative nucleotidyltransferase with HDIG domain